MVAWEYRFAITEPIESHQHFNKLQEKVKTLTGTGTHPCQSPCEKDQMEEW
jgi:hypothetical protein